MTNEQLNRIWPGWVIDREIGKGAYGMVYEATHSENGLTAKAAIKEISIPQNEADIYSLMEEGMDHREIIRYFEKTKDEFEKEIAVMSRLKGIQHIVNLEDFKILPKENEIGWDIFIRMELLQPMLALQQKATMDEKTVLQMGIDICSALTICESMGIIHRDIKPGNIFYHPISGFKLGDFGIARQMESLGGTLSRKGTPNYMAPEVANGRYDKRADFYSLGIVLYRYLNNNHLPFLDTIEKRSNPTERENALMRRASGEKLPPPKNASPFTAAVVLKACKFDPNERYSTAEEMKNALVSALDRLQNNTTEEEKTVSLWENEHDTHLESSRTTMLPYMEPTVKPVGYAAPVQQIPSDVYRGKKRKQNEKTWVIFLIAMIIVLLGSIAAIIAMLKDKQIRETGDRVGSAEVVEESISAEEISHTATDESTNECLHAIWDMNDSDYHSCQECGLREKHDFIVNSEGEVVCTVCGYLDEARTEAYLLINSSQTDEETDEIIPEESSEAEVIVETPLADLPIVEVTNFGKDENGNPTTVYSAEEDVAIGNWSDNFGNVYADSYKFWVIQAENSANRESITYDVSGYDYITGEMACSLLKYGRCHEGTILYVNFYLDDKIVYTSADITPKTQPISYGFNLNGGKLLKIECVTYEHVIGEAIVSAILGRIDR